MKLNLDQSGFLHWDGAITAPVFRESRVLARQLELKPLPAGTFLYLDEEKLVITLSREVNSVRVTLLSTISGQVVNSHTVTPPKGKFDINLIVVTFKEETADFVSQYFEGTEDPTERIVDFDEVLDDMKMYLKDISKIKR